MDADSFVHQWTLLASDLAGVSESLQAAIPSADHDNQQLVVRLLHARALQSFKSARMLAHEELFADAWTVIRSATESALAIAATAHDPGFVERLIDADGHRRRVWANACLNDPELRQDHGPSEIAELEAVAAAHATAKSLNWDAIARKCGTRAKVLYNLHYRPHSWRAHVSIESLNDFFGADAASKAGAGRAIADAIQAACDVQFYSAIGVAEFFGQAPIYSQIMALHGRYAALIERSPHAEGRRE